jgi:hypothetical protein
MRRKIFSRSAKTPGPCIDVKNLSIPAEFYQSSGIMMEGQGNNNSMNSGVIIQPPSHVTIPSFANWFDINDIHEIEK